MRDATFSFSIKVPDPPNFLRLGDSEQTIAVEKMNDSALRAIGKQWTALLLMKARNRRKAVK